MREAYRIEPDLSASSPLSNSAKRLYELVTKKKNVTRSKETVIRLEENLLKAFKIDLGSKTLRDEQVVVRKRKNFEDLTSRTVKCARVKSVVEHLESDKGLEPKVLDKLESRRVNETREGEDFGLSCLALMKTMGISNTKYDDLRWWVKDMVKKNMDLSSMPTSKELMEKVQREMVPSNLKTLMMLTKTLLLKKFKPPPSFF